MSHGGCLVLVTLCLSWTSSAQALNAPSGRIGSETSNQSNDPESQYDASSGFSPVDGLQLNDGVAPPVRNSSQSSTSPLDDYGSSYCDVWDGKSASGLNVAGEVASQR